MSETMLTCGTGLNNTIPGPGDPNMTSAVLTATSVLGGIGVRWTYPSMLDHAVAHTRLYRGTSDDWSSSSLLDRVSGTNYFDQYDGEEEIRYYYWIKFISVNGTVGSLIGPASATTGSTIQDIIDGMVGRVTESTLNQFLKERIDTISDISSALTTERQERLFGSAIVDALFEDIREVLDFQGVLISDEVSTRITENSLLVTSINALGASVSEEISAAVVDAKQVFASDMEAYTIQIQFAISEFETQTAAALNETVTYTDMESAIALQIETLEANSPFGEAFVQEWSEVQSSQETLSAMHVIKTDVNGHVAGYGIYNSGITSEFIVRADTFAVGNGNAAHNDVFPFIIAPVNGVNVIAMNAKTLIPDAHIDTLHLRGDSVVVAEHFGENADTGTSIRKGTYQAVLSHQVDWGADSKAWPSAVVVTGTLNFVSKPGGHNNITTTWLMVSDDNSKFGWYNAGKQMNTVRASDSCSAVSTYKFAKPKSRYTTYYVAAQFTGEDGNAFSQGGRSITIIGAKR